VEARPSSVRLIGRDTELAVLDDLVRSIPDPAAPEVTVLVEGEAGIGKSLLVEVFTAAARDDGLLVATGACAPFDGGGLPYGPIVGVLQDVVRQLEIGTATDLLGPAIDGLGLPLRGRRTGGGAELRDQAAPLDKTRLFGAMLSSFAALADATPAILVFEDLHWADSASAELFDFLTRNLRHSPILLVGTVRNDELGDQQPIRGPLRELRRHPHVVRLELQGLRPDETATMLRTILGRDPDAALIESVHGRSGGNPFFIEELTTMPTSPGISEQMRRLILQRTDHLDVDARRLLTAAASIGVVVDRRLLAEVVELSDDRFEHALGELVDNRIVMSGADGTDYRFRHALLYEAVSGGLTAFDRTQLHQRVATVLEARPELSATGPGHAVAELAGHWWEAGRWPEALRASIHAGEAAAGVFAFAEAQAHYERALLAWDRLPDPSAWSRRDHASVLESAADAAYLAGHGRRAVELSRAACSEIDPALDPVRAAVCLASLSRNSWSIGESQASLQTLGEALAVLPADAPSVELARILAEQGRGLMLLSRFTEAQERCTQAIDIAWAAGARAEAGHAMNSLGVVRAHLGTVDEGIDLLRGALQIAEDLRDPDSLNRAYANLSHLLYLAGRLEDSAAVTLDGLAAGEVLGGIRLNAAALNSSFALLRLGRWDEATALVIEADTVSGNCTMSVDMLQAEVALRRGKFDEAADAIKRLDDRSRSLEDVQFRGEFHMLRAALALERARPQDALDDVDHALALATITEDRIYTPQMCLLGIQALVDLAGQRRTDDGGSVDGRDELRRRAAALAEEAERIAAPLDPDGSPILLAAASALQCRAEESRLAGSDPVLWDRAASTWAHLAYAFQVAYCRWREAEALLIGSRRRSGASASLRTAWAIAVELGAVPLRERIESLARTARIGLEARPEPHGRSAGVRAGLTPREIEVLGLLTDGLTDAQIGEELFISKKTASVHVSNLIRKLSVSNRVEAGAVGRSVGLTGADRAGAG